MPAVFGADVEGAAEGKGLVGDVAGERVPAEGTGRDRCLDRQFNTWFSTSHELPVFVTFTTSRLPR